MNSTIGWRCPRGLATVLLLAGLGLANRSVAETPWRPLPLISGGRPDPAWAHIGWGGFAVEDGTLRTVCDERGMGLLLYTPERFGDCQIRVVYKPEKPKSNSGVVVRLDDGILAWTNKESIAVHRDAKGRLPKEMLQRLMDAAEAEEGIWYAVHHGYEVQIMDDNDPMHRTGAVYGLAESAPLPPAPPDGWRTMVITLRGEVVSVDLDGKRINHFDAAATNLPARRRWTEPKRDAKRPHRGFLALQNHDLGDVVWFKEVSVRPIESPETRRPAPPAP